MSGKLSRSQCLHIENRPLLCGGNSTEGPVDHRWFRRRYTTNLRCGLRFELLRAPLEISRDGRTDASTASQPTSPSSPPGARVVAAESNAEILFYRWSRGFPVSFYTQTHILMRALAVETVVVDNDGIQPLLQHVASKSTSIFPILCHSHRIFSEGFVFTTTKRVRIGSSSHRNDRHQQLQAPIRKLVTIVTVILAEIQFRLVAKWFPSTVHYESWNSHSKTTQRFPHGLQRFF